MSLRIRRDLPSDVTNRITRGDAAMRRILKASALLAAVTLVAVTGAGAALSPSYQVAGIELGAQQPTVSPFTGVGVGSAGDRGFWQASVTHDSLANCTAVGSSCAISGGTFTLRSNSGGSQLSGTFTGGSYQLTAAAPGCGRQSFALTGNVTTAAGPMSLTATVTKYRFQARGQCVALVSTVQGSLSPAAPSDGGGGGQL
jgi:hypothetical protein